MKTISILSFLCIIASSSIPIRIVKTFVRENVSTITPLFYSDIYEGEKQITKFLE